MSIKRVADPPLWDVVPRTRTPSLHVRRSCASSGTKVIGKTARKRLMWLVEDMGVKGHAAAGRPRSRVMRGVTLRGAQPHERGAGTQLRASMPRPTIRQGRRARAGGTVVGRGGEARADLADRYPRARCLRWSRTIPPNVRFEDRRFAARTGLTMGRLLDPAGQGPYGLPYGLAVLSAGHHRNQKPRRARHGESRCLGQAPHPSGSTGRLPELVARSRPWTSASWARPPNGRTPRAR